MTPLPLQVAKSDWMLSRKSFYFAVESSTNTTKDRILDFHKPFGSLFILSVFRCFSLCRRCRRPLCIYYVFRVSALWQYGKYTPCTHVALLSAQPKEIRNKITRWFCINRKYFSSTSKALHHMMDCCVYSRKWLWTLGTSVLTCLSPVLTKGLNSLLTSSSERKAADWLFPQVHSKFILLHPLKCDVFFVFVIKWVHQDWYLNWNYANWIKKKSTSEPENVMISDSVLLFTLVEDKLFFNLTKKEFIRKV